MLSLLLAQSYNAKYMQLNLYCEVCTMHYAKTRCSIVCILGNASRFEQLCWCCVLLLRIGVAYYSCVLVQHHSLGIIHKALFTK